MALIYCPECGKQISDSSLQCIYCGYSLKAEEEKKNKKKKKILTLIVSAAIASVAIVVGIVLIITNVIIPSSKYSSAVELFEKGKYEESITAFKELEGYKDSETKIKEAEEKIEKIAAMEHLDSLKQKLKTAKSKCISSRTSLTSDGMSIVVDGEDKNDFSSLLDIYTIAEELGLPDSLTKEMVGTNALMGKQSETFGVYQVSWSYHPDNGLDAIFKIAQ